MRILAIANAHALAHISRLLEVAKILRERGHELLFAGHGKYLKVATWDGFPIREVPYMPVDQAVKAIKSQKLWELYPAEQVKGFIEAELELYKEFKPDLVLLDNRITARTSAEVAGIKTAAIVNVHMSVYKRYPFFSASNLIGRDFFPGLGVLDRLCNAGECLFYDKLVMGGLNRTRRKLGLKALYSYQHEEGDLTFFADIPEFNPVRVVPGHARFIGPLTWHNSLPAPECLSQLSDSKPTVYMSLGSEGLEDMIQHLHALAAKGVQVVVATGAAEIDSQVEVPEGVFLEEYINTDSLLPHCDLVCCHGGNGTLYQALSYGIPIVVVATHQEQSYGGKRVQRLKLGRSMMSKSVEKRGFQVVVDAVIEVMEDKTYRHRARSFSLHMQDWDGAAMVADAVENLARA